MVGKLNYFNCTAILRFYECICGWYIELLPMNENDETSQMLHTGGLAELLSSDLQHFNQRCCAPYKSRPCRLHNRSRPRLASVTGPTATVWTALGERARSQLTEWNNQPPEEVRSRGEASSPRHTVYVAAGVGIHMFVTPRGEDHVTALMEGGAAVSLSLTSTRHKASQKNKKPLIMSSSSVMKPRGPRL